MKKQEVLRLIDGSIKKWSDIVAGKLPDKGITNCPLCQEFFKGDTGRGCYKCPIREYTGKHECRSTPYTAWAHWCNTYAFLYNWYVNLENWRLANRELTFLYEIRLWYINRK